MPTAFVAPLLLAPSLIRCKGFGKALRTGSTGRRFAGPPWRTDAPGRSIVAPRACAPLPPPPSPSPSLRSSPIARPALPVGPPSALSQLPSQDQALDLAHAGAIEEAPQCAWAGTTRTRVVAATIVARALLPLLAAVALAHANPVLAAPAAGVAGAFVRRALDPAGFAAGLTASFLLVLASEIGDKTFFISALLSMKYSRALVLLGSMLALGSMTVISVVIGQVFHALPASLNSTIPFDDYAAAALLLWFGFQSIRDALAMSKGGGDDGELRDATEVVEEATAKDVEGPSGVRIVTETSSLVFLAEWGDKSMLATVALAAAQSPLGVIVGGISGHFVASIIAVVGGSFLGKYISERTAKLVGGILFWVFALLTIFNLF
jgi:putative Ca2+/H+ antiporter (TMEM165/GDT1 family)